MLTGIILAILTALVIIGGVKSISKFCEVLVPFIVFSYFAGCIVILIVNAHYILPAIAIIIKHAFTPMAAGGGFVGASFMMTARYGIARGFFSNESGLGSAPIIAATAQTRNPVRQALVSSSDTFWEGHRSSMHDDWSRAG
mgnify:FL=1